MLNSLTLTVVAGTPIRIATMPVRANFMMITMLTAGTGRGFILNSDAGPTTPYSATVPKTANNFVTELAPATATAPGGVFQWPPASNVGGAAAPAFDLQDWLVDGSHTGDTIQVSWQPVQ